MTRRSISARPWNKVESLAAGGAVDGAAVEAALAGPALMTVELGEAGRAVIVTPCASPTSTPVSLRYPNPPYSIRPYSQQTVRCFGLSA